jgi:hypothetical protein
MLMTRKILKEEIEIREGSQTLEFKIDGFVKTILLNGLSAIANQQLVSCTPSEILQNL